MGIHAFLSSRDYAQVFETFSGSHLAFIVCLGIEEMFI